MKNTFKTKDKFIAAYLHMNDCQIQNTIREKGSKVIEFEFYSDTDTMKELAEEVIWDKTVRMSPSKFISSIKFITGIINSSHSILWRNYLSPSLVSPSSPSPPSPLGGIQVSCRGSRMVP